MRHPFAIPPSLPSHKPRRHGPEPLSNPSSCPRRARAPGPLVALILIAIHPLSHAASRPNWRHLLRQPEAWYSSPDARHIANTIRSHQSTRGDWPKNLDTTAQPASTPRDAIRGTFDNGATVNEVRFLARSHRATGSTDDRAAVETALRHILDAQYPNGGWPQSFPPGRGYARHITFNDHTTVHLLELLRETRASPDFAWLPPALRDRAHNAFDRGIQCILRCQVRLDGRLTVWCAQHDEVTLEPRPARAFEPASLSGSESASLLRLLMSLDPPPPGVPDAIRAGAAWFDSARLTGFRIETHDGDRVVVPDPNAPPLWARFYDLKTGRPLFTGRDGIPRENLADIELERRTGYAWYGSWGDTVAREFEAWSRRHP